MARQPGTRGAHPLFEIGDNRPAFPLSHRQAVAGRDAVDRALNGEEFVDARDCQEFRAEVGHDRSKGARRCRDAKNLAYLTLSLINCWPAPTPRRLSTLT